MFIECIMKSLLINSHFQQIIYTMALFSRYFVLCCKLCPLVDPCRQLWVSTFPSYIKKFHQIHKAWCTQWIIDLVTKLLHSSAQCRSISDRSSFSEMSTPSPLSVAAFIFIFHLIKLVSIGGLQTICSQQSIYGWFSQLDSPRSWVQSHQATGLLSCSRLGWWLQLHPRALSFYKKPQAHQSQIIVSFWDPGTPEVRDYRMIHNPGWLSIYRSYPIPV